MVLAMRTSGTPTRIRSECSSSPEALTMIIGANHAAIISEIGVVDGVLAPVVVHAMKARDKFLR